MIKLYYTGAKEFEGIQKMPSKSLGGNISSSVVPNGLMNSLFSDISLLDLQLGSKQLRILAIKNEGANPITNFTVHVEHDENDENIADFYIGYSLPQADDCGVFGETVEDEEAEPYHSELQISKSNLTKLNISNLEKDNYILLYLQRRIKQNQLSREQEIDAIQKNYEEGKKPNRAENVQLIFNYS